MKHTAPPHWKTSLWQSPAWRRACSWLVFLVAVMLLLPPSARHVAAQAPAAPPPIVVPAGAAPANADQPRPDANKPETGVARAINFTNPLELFRLGGPTMWPIALCSVVMAAFFFERLIALRRGRVIPRPFVRRILPQIRNGELDQHEAHELCEENNSPIAQIFAGAISKWGRPAVEVEQAIVDAGERATFALRKNLRVFSAVHTLGPLLGLVGTVFGIIRAFNALSLKGAEDRGQQLANGIAQSLLATFFGLIVAIPALVCYLWFMSRADQLTYEMDGLAQDMVGAISAEALHGRTALDARAAKTRRGAKPEASSSSG